MQMKVLDSILVVAIVKKNEILSKTWINNYFETQNILKTKLHIKNTNKYYVVSYGVLQKKKKSVNSAFI